MDLIERQAAIDALKNDMASLDHIIKGMSAYDVRLDAYVSQRNQVDYDIDTINNLPAAQPKQRTGKWIPSDSQCGIRCSVCGVPVDDFCHSIDYIDLVYKPNYCPNCGLKMM